MNCAPHLRHPEMHDIISAWLQTNPLYNIFNISDQALPSVLLLTFSGKCDSDGKHQCIFLYTHLLSTLRCMTSHRLVKSCLHEQTLWHLHSMVLMCGKKKWPAQPSVGGSVEVTGTVCTSSTPLCFLDLAAGPTKSASLTDSASSCTSSSTSSGASLFLRPSCFCWHDPCTSERNCYCMQAVCGSDLQQSGRSDS